MNRLLMVVVFSGVLAGVWPSAAAADSSRAGAAAITQFFVLISNREAIRESARQEREARKAREERRVEAKQREKEQERELRRVRDERQRDAVAVRARS